MRSACCFTESPIGKQKVPASVHGIWALCWCAANLCSLGTFIFQEEMNPQSLTGKYLVCSPDIVLLKGESTVAMTWDGTAPCMLAAHRYSRMGKPRSAHKVQMACPNQLGIPCL